LAKLTRLSKAGGNPAMMPSSAAVGFAWVMESSLRGPAIYGEFPGRGNLLA
jgi:hypothetical protein